ncbi:MAG: hypothetical protein IT383_18905 [Deltaproteobacteria bacterium]|nr:hypothetical protein [Deltaproteobacteria bacterium]
MSPERAKLVDELVRKLRHEAAERVGPNATFEQQSDASFAVMRDVLDRAEEVRV